MSKRISKLILGVFPALLIAISPFLVSNQASAATVTVPMTGTARAATAGEITALGNPIIDAGTTIPGRGNVSQLNTATGWNVNPNRDLDEGYHELGVIVWNPVNLPECASSIRVTINATIERRSMDISTVADSLEWAHFLLKGTPTSHEAWDIAIRDTQGRYKTTTFNGTNLDTGEEVPANQTANYTITRSNVDTTSLTRADLAAGLFSGMYLDAYSVGPHNVTWFSKINSANVTYDDSGCNPTPVTPTPQPVTPTPVKPKTGNLAVASLVTITLLVAIVFGARMAKLKMHSKTHSAK